MTTHVENRSRPVVRIVTAVPTLEGEGVVVRRAFPTRALDMIDPFLLLDEMGPVDLAPGEAKGFPWHPHRGFETVTYVLEGRLAHEDSAGHSGRLGPGDVQWMTAGAGVVHSEMPEAEFARQGGRLHGFQLWVNLPRRDKTMAPRYQEVPGSRIPRARSDDGLAAVTVIAGEALGARAVIDTRTPILYLHYRLEPGGRIVQPVPAGYAVFARVFRGEGRFGPDGRRAADGQLVLFGPDGDAVQAENPAETAGPLEFLLIGGQPLGEPVARYGPFVMNTEEEIRQAIEDYRSGRLGREGRA
ncbi:MAG TPA: pirin family protein [Thermodesulfobacteriota bacterium]|nr:pirin family protein [Thermodesulfobacteriota bacterium]